MEINYRDLLNQTNINEVFVLKTPFLTDDVKFNYTIHQEIKTYDDNLKDFKLKKIATLDGFNFLCKSPKDFTYDDINYKTGDDVFLNYKNNEYKIVNLNTFDLNKDFECLDYFRFKEEEKDIENSKKIGVSFFVAKLESDYKKRIQKLKEESSLNIGIIKIKNKP